MRMPAAEPSNDRTPPAAVDLSVVSPAHNEEENVAPLVDEILRALDPLGLSYEIVMVDDGSTDDTLTVLDRLRRDVEPLRVLRMLRTPAGRGHGQSAAFHAGFRASRGRILAVLDADRQNDPADIPRLLEAMEATGADLVQGDRSHARRDNVVRRGSSAVGRWTRRLILGDAVRDTGCSLRVMRREVALALPLHLRSMHRFIPVTARHLGYTVIEVPVNHRPRTAGVAKYGVWDRAIPGLIDCFAVRWMMQRRRPVGYREIDDLGGFDAEPEQAGVEIVTASAVAGSAADAAGVVR